MSTFLLFSLIMLLVSSASAQYEIRTMYSDSACSGSPHILLVTPKASGCSPTPCDLAVRGGYFVTTCDSSDDTAGFAVVDTQYTSNTTCSGTISSIVGLASGCHQYSGTAADYFFASCAASGYEISLYSDADCTSLVEQQTGSLGCSDGFNYECGSSASTAVTAGLLFIAGAILSLVASF